MGKSWDSSGIAFDQEMWADLLRILKPGGHLLAFSGSRTYHRMACAIEDAGFEIRDMIEWVYGSGFPKSLNIGKAVDKLQGNKREIVGDNPNYRPISGKVGYLEQSNFRQTNGMATETKGTSPYEGYGTALKPAHEPCVLARKPIEGTVANNVLKHGTGGLNIDGTRIEGTDEVPTFTRDLSQAHGNKFGAGTKVPTKSNGFTGMGRFPANLIHDGSDEVEAVFPQTNASKAASRGNQAHFRETGFIDREVIANTDTVRGHNDNGGSASRFFYTAKASKSERNAGLEGFEVKDPDIRSDTAKGSYTSKGIAPQSNHHPTVKPLSLTKYLATLIKPPTGGRLLVPFSGSGSEMIGALQAGWEYVEGVELTEEYIPIAEARIKYWLAQKETENPQLPLEDRS